VEGGCYASSEYLLCGVPVVSTPCKGGRDIWYNDYNSIVCDPDSSAVSVAVSEFVKAPRDPERIRSMHLAQSDLYRAEFVRALDSVFKEFRVDNIDAKQYFSESFFHKMRKSYRPDFDKIFS
jgi:glycosyltransferase involved in cell wall biosynthesis